MNKFKVGDLVECVDIEEFPESLTLGKEYTVTCDQCPRGFIEITADDGRECINFGAEQFKLSEPKKETPSLERLQEICAELEEFDIAKGYAVIFENRTAGNIVFTIPMANRDKDLVLFKSPFNDVESEFTDYKETLKPKRVLMSHRALYRKTIFCPNGYTDEVMSICNDSIQTVHVNKRVEELQDGGYEWGDGIDSQRYNFYGEDV